MTTPESPEPYPVEASRSLEPIDASASLQPVDARSPDATASSEALGPDLTAATVSIELRVATSSPVPTSPATASVASMIDPIQWLRDLPFDLALHGGPEGFGRGSIQGTGFASQATGIANVSLPTLIRSEAIPASGWWGSFETRLGMLAAGARGFSLSIEPGQSSIPTSSTYTPAFPARQWDCYARLGALSVGMRQESYEGAGALSGDFQSLFGGLNGNLLNLFDTVGLDYDLLAGWGIQKPTAVPAAVAHIPAEGQLDLSIRLPWFVIHTGMRVGVVANVEPTMAWNLIMNPTALVPSEASAALASATTLNTTSWSLYAGPYARVGFEF